MVEMRGECNEYSRGGEGVHWIRNEPSICGVPWSRPSIRKLQQSRWMPFAPAWCRTLPSRRHPRNSAVHTFLRPGSPCRRAIFECLFFHRRKCRTGIFAGLPTVFCSDHRNCVLILLCRLCESFLLSIGLFPPCLFLSIQPSPPHFPIFGGGFIFRPPNSAPQLFPIDFLCFFQGG